MEPAPLPPHERSWRHPSELAAARPAHEPLGASGRRALLLAGGSTVVVLALVLAATISTGRSPAPYAVSATTVPTVVQFQPTVSSAVATSGDDVGVWRSATNGVTGSSVFAISGAPNAISAAPVADPDDDTLSLARRVPGADDAVLVLTKSHTYRLLWSDIEAVVAPDDAVVVNMDGGLVAVFVSGELRLLVDA